MIEIVLGSFFGDCSKGQCVNNFCDKNSIVVRFSGANQIGHNVKHNNLQHCFRNFGSGTLKGVPTYWSEYCVCDLHTVFLEAAELHKIGILPKIIFSPFCELVTPFDVISQWNNSDNRKHGTVGTGFKPTLDRVKNGYSLKIIDAKNLYVLREKVYNIAEHYYHLDSTTPMQNLNDWIYEINTMANKLPIFNLEYLNNFKNLIFEGSQGILLDQIHGVMPYCTPSNTTSKNAMEIIHKLNRNDSINVNYVCRPYITRHGNGPTLSDKPILNVEDQNNPWNDFQKSFRSYEFDIELLKHSLMIDSYYSLGTDKTIVISHGNELSQELFYKISELNLPIKIFEFEKWLKAN